MEDFKILVANDEIFQLELITLNFNRKVDISPITVMNGKDAYESVIKNIQIIQEYKN